ncbi:MAG: epoxyqueuosine reductase QueH [Candidatus Alcyoniella australis]|nr:epoxyqueuosine reductase QueH [Candidatus Alcyoniella australis]
MDVLLHICCAPCAIVPIDTLRAMGHRVIGFAYNPNVHPWTEYRKRLEWVERYCADQGVELHVRDEYDVGRWVRRAVLSNEPRCRECYIDRLYATAAMAAKLGAQAFSSTLFYSKYQDHALMSAIAQDAAQEQGSEFLYHNFSSGWSEGIKRSRELGIYRQQYCGCIFSEQDRYLRAKNKVK